MPACGSLFFCTLREESPGREGGRYWDKGTAPGLLRPDCRNADEHPSGGEITVNLKTKLFGHVYQFKNIKEVLAKANEEKSGDRLAGIIASSMEERVAAKHVLSNLTVADLRKMIPIFLKFCNGTFAAICLSFVKNSYCSRFSGAIFTHQKTTLELYYSR